MSDVIPHCPVHPDLPLEARRRGWYCPVCDQRLLSFREWPQPPLPPGPQTSPDMASLPWLVATPLAAARASDCSPEARHALACSAAFACLRLAALLLLRDALAHNTRGVARALGMLSLPGWRPWLELLQQLTAAVERTTPLLAGVVAGWQKLVASGELECTLGVLAHGDSPARLELSDVEHMATTLFGSGPTFFRAVGENWAQVVSLQGVASQGRWRVVASPLTFSPPADCHVVAWADGVALPLEPFVLPGTLTPVAPDLVAGEPAVVLLLATAEGGLYQGLGAPVRCCHEWPKVSSQRRHVLRHEAAPRAAEHTRERLAALRRQLWQVGPFLPRPAVEERLAAALRLPGRAVVVAGESGAGVTTLLARLAAHLLHEVPEEELSPPLAALAGGSARDPDVVALVCGPASWTHAVGETARQTLASVVGRAVGADGSTWTGLEELWAHLGSSVAADPRLGRKVWLLLDGLDEDEHGAELLAALDTALPQLAAHPWLRLVIGLGLATCRRLWLPQHGQRGWFTNTNYLVTFPDPRTGEPRPWLEVPPLACEGATFYVARQQADPVRACPLPVSLLPPAALAALANPLQAHLFHESRRWLAAPPAELDLHALMTTFLRRHCEACGVSVAELAKRLWNLGQGKLPLAEAWAWTERWIASLPEPAHHAALSGPVETLLRAGILLAPEGDVLWPPSPSAGLCLPHLVAAEALLGLAARLSAEDHPAPLAAAIASSLARTHGTWSLCHELGGALAGLATQAVAAGDVAALTPLLLAGEQEAAVLALARVLATPEARAVVLSDCATTAAADVEACRRLVRACAVAGEPTNWADVSWHQALLTAAIAHFPEDPSFRCQRAHLFLAAAQAAAQTVQALHFLRQARADWDIVRARWPAAVDTLAPLAATLVQLGNVAAVLGHSEEAGDALRRAVPLVRALLAREPANIEARRQLASALVALASLAVASGRHVEAERLLGEATPTVEALCAAAPEASEHQRLWGRLLHARGLAAHTHERLEQAALLLEQAAQVLGAVAAASGSALDELYVVQAMLDGAAVAVQRRAGSIARAMLEDGLRAVATFPARKHDLALAVAEAELVVCLARLAPERTHELELWQRARAVMAPLASHEGIPRRWQTLATEIAERLKDAEGGAEPKTSPSSSYDELPGDA